MSNPNTTEPIFNPYEIIEGEKYMSDKQLEHFRQILLNWKNNLIAEVNRTVHQLQEASASNFPDPNDRASLEEEVSIELRNRDRERKLIKKIDVALEKIIIARRIKRTTDYKQKTKKIGRNEKCPCGSGKKYKLCCMNKIKDIK